jgi:hypothetical protein
VATGESKLMTAGNIAKALSVPDAKVKKAIAALGLKPKAKKGASSVCIDLLTNIGDIIAAC